MTQTHAPDPSAGYAPGEGRPLAAYGALTAGFFGLLSAALIAGRAMGRDLDRPGLADVALGGLAVQKLSRLIPEDKVTSFIRAPVTRFQEPSGQGELEEAARGEGLRYAVGELLVCPYCLGQWVAGAFTVGYVWAPRTTRLLAALWTIHAVADGAQLAYSAAEQGSL